MGTQERYDTHNQRGSAFVEVALLIALVALMGVASVNVVGKNLSNSLNESAKAMGACGGGHGEECLQQGGER